MFSGSTLIRDSAVTKLIPVRDQALAGDCMVSLGVETRFFLNLAHVRLS